MTSFDHAYLSPHLDDVAFSCAGAIASQRARGERVLVFTICAAEPRGGQPAAHFIEEAARAQGTDIAEFARERRGEDERAMALLDVQYDWGTDLDIAFRLPSQYPSFESICLGEVIAGDPLIASVTKLVNTLAPEARLHAPLGIGRHLDHRIVHAAAWNSGRAVSFYEDFPYVTDRDGALRERLTEIGTPLRPIVTDISRFIERRIEAILTYRTQVGAFEDEVRRRVVTYATMVGHGVPAERSWERLD